MTHLGPRKLRDLLQTAVDDGELVEGTKADLLADRLIGPLFLRRLIYHDELTTSYVEELVSATLSGLLTK